MKVDPPVAADDSDEQNTPARRVLAKLVARIEGDPGWAAFVFSNKGSLMALLWAHSFLTGRIGLSAEGADVLIDEIAMLAGIVSNSA